MKIIFIFFIALFFPFFVNAGVVINEIAWMGGYSYEGETAQSAGGNEWLEIFSSNTQTLDGWTISTADGGMTITLSGSVSAGGYYLIERTDDTTVPNVAADLITPFGNGLSNAGEILILKDANANMIDTVDASSGWPAGDNTTKETMQKSGSVWITSQGTPKAQNAGSTSGNSGQENNTTGTSTASTTEETQSNQNSSSGFIDKKQFRAEIAGDDATAIVGVEKFFEGKGFDLDGKLLTSGDFLWNFGDGAHGRGRNISHVFRYPGIYRIVFDVSSGTYNASDTIVVTIIPSPMGISEVKPGTHGFIELSNTSEFELDISYWGIGNGALVYYFPEDTFVLPGSFLVIPYIVSSIEFPSFGTASLFYPNATVADSFSYGGITKEDESFHDVNNVSRLGIESPGSGKFVARQIVRHETYSASPTQPDVTSYTPQDTVALIEAEEWNRTEVENMNESNQTAAPVAAENHFYQKSGFWFVIIFLFAILSGFGVFIIKKFNSIQNYKE